MVDDSNLNSNLQIKYLHYVSVMKVLMVIIWHLRAIAVEMHLKQTKIQSFANFVDVCSVIIVDKNKDNFLKNKIKTLFLGKLKKQI